MGQKAYRDKETLYELYHGKGMTKVEIANELGCSDVTVGNWMEKLGVPTARVWKRIDFLKELYINQKMTQQEIAERLGTNKSNISNQLVEADIETRKRGELQHPTIYISQSGYMTCRHRLGGHDNDRVSFRIHRLVAVAEYGYDDVAGNIVHHKNNHKLDNRPENLEPISRSEHTKHHHENDDIIY